MEPRAPASMIWMRAGKHQCKTTVRISVSAAAASNPPQGVANSPFGASALELRRAASIIDGQPFTGSIRQRRRKGLRQGVLGSRHVPRARREECDQLAVTA